jgi:TolB-like protein
LRLLGDFEVEGKLGQPVKISAKKGRALLALLALSASGCASRQRLANLIWSDRADEQARSSLRQALAALRRELAPTGATLLSADDDKVTLDLSQVEIDVATFRQLSHSDDVDDLRLAMRLYRGELLTDSLVREPQFEEWVAGERARLHALAVTTAEKLWAMESRGGRIELSKRLVALEPLKESAHRSLMQAYSEAGENALALQHYAVCCELLEAELGIAPGHEIEALRQRILAEASNAAPARVTGDSGNRNELRPNDESLVPKAPPLPEKPSIAVLPFANLSGYREQEYFADGMVEEIITALSRFRQLFVIARNSSFTYKGRAVDVKQVGSELGVRYVLEGSVRKAGNKVRINGQLIDVSNGAHLWADHFNGGLEDIFDLQDRITSSVVGAIAPKLEQAEIARSRLKPTENLDAYDYYLRGLAVLHQWSKEGNTQALSHFHEAIRLDPNFAAAHGMAARAYVQRNSGGWIADRVHEIAEAEKLARRAVELGRDDAVALCTAGFALADICGAVKDGDAFIDRSIALNPNLAAAWIFSGWTKASLGEAEVALQRLDRARRLSPYDPQTLSVDAASAFAHFIARRYSEALFHAEAAVRNKPDFLLPRLIAAASAALAGQDADAQIAMKHARQLDPDLRLSNVGEVQFMQPTDFALWTEGLRMAGLPQ